MNKGTKFTFPLPETGTRNGPWDIKDRSEMYSLFLAEMRESRKRYDPDKRYGMDYSHLRNHCPNPEAYAMPMSTPDWRGEPVEYEEPDEPWLEAPKWTIWRAIRYPLSFLRHQIQAEKERLFMQS